MLKDSALIVNNSLIPSRIFFAPINTGFSYNNHLDEKLFHFHSLRSGNKIGISYVGNVAISDDSRTNINTLTINKENKGEWSLLAETIAKKGSVPGIQLGCRLSSIPAQREWINTNPDDYIKKAGQEILSYDSNVFEKVANCYVESAKVARSCGFKAIQIHAAHGYFLSLLMSPSFNFRGDIYSAEKLRLIKEIINRIHLAVPDTIIDIRISVLEGVKPMLQEFHEKKVIIKHIVNLPVNIISLSNGIYNINKYYIYPTAQIKRDKFLALGRYFALRYPGSIWNVAGNILDPGIDERYDFPNMTYSVGRALISDPLMVKKYYNGKIDEIKRCTNCGNCHYYSKSQLFMKESCTLA